ncbi:MAG: hypothetical protein IT431_12555 [Phycisphaerales bacterium]|nr:hypothetical protein [Phycisphaerales bacterium]
MLPGLLLLLALAAALGLTLLTLGLRGRQINNHPICRRCKFDLVGVYPGIERCPECGAELHTPRAIRPGARRRRRGVLVAAAAILLIGLGGGGAMGWALITGYNWYPHAPVALLETLARSASVQTQTGALNEIVARHAAGGVPDERLHRLAVEGLARQADAARPWAVGWGNAIEAAADTGLLSAEQLAGYLQRSIEFELDHAERVAPGEEVMVSVRFRPLRCGDNLKLVAIQSVTSLRIDGGPGELISVPRRSSFFINGPGTTSATSFPVTLDAPPGRHELVAVASADLTKVSGFVSPASPPATDTTVTAVLRRPFTILEGPFAGPVLVPDAGMASKIRGALSAGPLSITAEDESGVTLDGEVHGHGVPVNCAFEVLIRVDGLDYPWSMLVLSEGGAMSTGATGLIEAPVGRRVDLVFRASTQILRRHTKFESAWDGEIVIEDVPVVRSVVQDE